MVNLFIRGGQLRFDYDPTVQQYELSFIKKIDGDLNSLANCTFSDLKEITGNLNADSGIKLPALKQVGQDCVFYGETNVELPSLRFIGGDLHMQGTKGISMPKLDELKGTAMIARSDLFEKLKGVHVIGDLYAAEDEIEKAKTFFRSNDVEGDVYIPGGKDSDIFDKKVNIS
jgi:hypothetical protein